MINSGQLEENLYRTMTGVTFTNFVSAAQAFCSAYAGFSVQVQSGTGGRATAIPAAQKQLEGILLGAYAARSLSGTAQLLGQGLLAFWQIQPWMGGVGPGQTTNPGHAGVIPALEALYGSGISEGDARFHARELAKICSMGVRQVIVTEYPPGDAPKVTSVM